MASFKKIAHRGASGEYPENSLLAFAKAIEARADMIELDCQLTRDGHVVIFHDERLHRITGARGSLRDKTLEQLKALDIGQWRKKSYKGERILTLEEAIDAVAGNVDLCIEIKSFPDSLPGIELKLLFILSHYDYLDHTLISSFDYRILARVRELAPEVAIGVISGSRVKEDPFEAASRLGAISINVQKELASRAFLRRAWDSGLDVYVWTVNDIREMEEFASLGVQGLISDFPEKLWKLNNR
jgi:glycerophosphoryl diester phosphodiesterase